jgi:hypothetical protein
MACLVEKHLLACLVGKHLLACLVWKHLLANSLSSQAAGCVLRT